MLVTTDVERMTLVCLGVRASWHAAARQRTALLVSLAALDDQVDHPEPANVGARQRPQACADDGGGEPLREPARDPPDFSGPEWRELDT